MDPQTFEGTGGSDASFHLLDASCGRGTPLAILPRWRRCLQRLLRAPAGFARRRDQSEAG
jgi:hypothetical protein